MTMQEHQLLKSEAVLECRTCCARNVLCVLLARLMNCWRCLGFSSFNTEASVLWGLHTHLSVQQLAVSEAVTNSGLLSLKGRLLPGICDGFADCKLLPNKSFHLTGSHTYCVNVCGLH
jgi:hypothetical protein